MLWEVDIYAAEGQPDIGAAEVAAAARELRIAAGLAVTSVRGFLIEGDLDGHQIDTHRRRTAEPIAWSRHKPFPPAT